MDHNKKNYDKLATLNKNEGKKIMKVMLHLLVKIYDSVLASCEIFASRILQRRSG